MSNCRKSQSKPESEVKIKPHNSFAIGRAVRRASEEELEVEEEETVGKSINWVSSVQFEEENT
jgi:hypothetical protein